MKELQFMFYAIRKNITNSAELRTSFFLNAFGMMLNNCSLLILWVFFLRTVNDIGGWKQLDVIALIGFVTLAFGFIFSFFNGLSKITSSVVGGGFDRFLLSPKTLLLRVATSSFGISAVGDIIYGFISLIIYSATMHLSFEAMVMVFAGVFIACVTFFAVLLLTQAVSFWIMDSIALSQSLFEVFLTPSLFVGGAFHGINRMIFTFIIPSLIVGTLPVEAVKHLDWSQMGLISIIALLFLALSIVLFHKGVQKYESSNLNTFGSH